MKRQPIEDEMRLLVELRQAQATLHRGVALAIARPLTPAEVSIYEAADRRVDELSALLGIPEWRHRH